MHAIITTPEPTASTTLELLVPQVKGFVPEAVATFNGRQRLPTLPAKLDRCALVGSGSILLGQRLGKEIDSHDTVIRVNRLPSPGLYPDFGRKIDIYMAEVMLLRNCSCYKDVYLGADTGTYCHFHGVQRCKYEALIFRGLFPRSPQRFPPKEPGCEPVCESPGLVCGEMAPEIHRAVQKIPAIRGHIPSAGFESFFAMAPLCNSIRLYGFGGGRNADGHFMNSKTHDYDAEHKVLEELAAGAYPESGWQPEERHPNYTAQTARVFAWFRAHITRLQNAGNLSVVKLPPKS